MEAAERDGMARRCLQSHRGSYNLCYFAQKITSGVTAASGHLNQGQENIIQDVPMVIVVQAIHGAGI